MVTALHALALALYLASEIMLAASLVGGRRGAPRWGTALVAGAVAVHAVGLAAYALRYGELPLVGLAASLSTLAFLIGVLLLGVAVVRDAGPVGLVLLPIVALLLVVAHILGIAPAGEPPAFRGLWFALHVVLAFLGYAGLALAFAAGFLYLLQFRALKGKRFGKSFRFFPALETLDRLGARALVVGFPALSLGLALGWAWTVRFQRSLAAADPQVIWGVLTWIIFLLALGARRSGAGGDRRGALASVVGFLIVVLAYVALRLTAAEGRAFL
ncbi:MAG: cytochrome c biogenesis protein CcsA [Gemmatimonadetes bacterium]|nr:cytochrome c biogenesis protein CcsA [Gemmatimonadota bacterium]